MGVTISRTTRIRATGLAMLGAFAVTVALVVAMMTNSFDRTVEVTLVTDRAGLMMAPKNEVKLHGVVIGRVGDVRLAGDRVAMTLKLDKDTAALVPANARARISPATVFGKKFIVLAAPAGGPQGRVRAGSVLETDHVGVEVNTLLANLNNVLTTMKPSEVNATLHAVAMTLHGKGNRLGDLLARTGDYAGALNASLPALRRDLRATADVANLYADVSPQLFRVLDNVTRISGTVVDKQKALRMLLTEVAKVGSGGTALFRENGAHLLQMLRLLEPTSALLGDYSPGLACFLKGESYAASRLEPVVGAGRHGEGPGTRVLVNVLPGTSPYHYPENLPEVRSKGKPQCYGLPLTGTKESQPKYDLPGAGYGSTTDATGGG